MSNGILLILKINGLFEFENFYRIIIPPVLFIITAAFKNTFFDRTSHYFYRV